MMSALDHSKIEGANNPEALNIDAQAARIARRAAAALRQSRAALVVRPPPHSSFGQFYPFWPPRAGQMMSDLTDRQSQHQASAPRLCATPCPTLHQSVNQLHLS